ncbi:uncharacterized protein LOC132616996 [Lycium barbarum]|uniref:uncharacterized protein LOC132616996 n=1 Tax=Lycium barbarum TaxID=112863 RepID=UPI00293E9145|nr:uncharacterized protein LOC132616996 [Lycium barbarum]
MQETGEDGYLCPSFNNFGYLAEMAAKISDEFQSSENNSFDGDNSGDEDFEFSLVSENPDTTEFIYNDGQTKFQSIFPVFNRDLLLTPDEDSKKVNDDKSASSIRIPLKNLFLEEQESSTSSEADELETIPEGTYCVWKPKITEPSPGKCKKSKSTGSASKRWPRIRDLLRRSNSDGKDSFVFLPPKKSIENNNIPRTISQVNSAENNVYANLTLILRDSETISDKLSAQRKTNQISQEKEKGIKDKTGKAKLAGKLKGSPAPAATQQALYYVRNREGKEVDKNRRKSYLPYRRDLIGFFAIGLSRPF